MNKHCNYNNAWNAKITAYSFFEEAVGGDLAFVSGKDPILFWVETSGVISVAPLHLHFYILRSLLLK